MCDKFNCVMSHLELDSSGSARLFCRQHEIFIYDTEICNYCMLASCNTCRGGFNCERDREGIVDELHTSAVVTAGS